MGGDGQVTFGDTILKQNALKIRRVYGKSVLSGFAGSVADALTLFDKFEQKLEEFNGTLSRASVELAKDWRTDKYLRRLDAQLAVMDKKTLLLISGTGDVLEPDDRILAIGSGGPYAMAAAKALIMHSRLNAANVVRTALEITSSICIYTNDKIIIEEL
jgi:ATP-dependent HslUV protease subunit HslV